MQSFGEKHPRMNRNPTRGNQNKEGNSILDFKMAYDLVLADTCFNS